MPDADDFLAEPPDGPVRIDEATLPMAYEDPPWVPGPGRRPALEARLVGGFAGPRVVRHDVIIPGLDPAHEGVRIAHLTDLHVGLLTSTKKIRRAIHRANAEKPDLTVMTGDFVCYNPKYLGLLRDLVSELHGPVYAVLGNHDYWTDGEQAQSMLEQAHVEVLRNQHTIFNLRGRAFQLVGIDDAVTAQADPVRAFRHLKPGHTRLVMTHVPSLADHAAAYGSALILAGHTHGGHVKIPVITAGLAARLGNPYLAGFFDLGRPGDPRARAEGLPPGGHSVLYVNCGVGSAAVPIRAGAPSEIAILTMRGVKPR